MQHLIGGGTRRRTRACAGLAALALTAGLAGCSSMPESGPPTRAVIGGAHDSPTGVYYLVPVSPAVLSVMTEGRHQDLARVFADGQATAPAQPIGIGDTLSVTIWEASGLFGAGQAGSHHNDIGAVANTSMDNQAASLPTQVVDQSGDISIPFAGRIPAAGLTPAQVEKEVVEALRGKTIAPQVLVTVAENGSSFATVTGDVNHPGRVPLSLTGTRILDGVALAGGGAAPTTDLAVQLTRGGVTRRVRLDAVVADPAENIYLRPGDLLYLEREPQSVVILGATQKNAEVAFGKPGMSLAEVVGNGGGLSDTRADPYGVFVFRYEPAGLVRSLGPATREPDPKTLVPVVFQINLKTPAGYFVAQSFSMHNGDLVYVANTETVQLSKIAILVNQFASIIKRSTYDVGNSYAY